MTPDGSRHVQLLAFEGELGRWALPSRAVLGVVEERDWRGAAAPHLAEVAGITVSAALLPVRVLLLLHERGHVPVRVRGPLTLVTVPATDVLLLPREFRGAHTFATQIALEGAKPSLIVLDAARLAVALTDHLVGSAPVAQSGGST